MKPVWVPHQFYNFDTATAHSSVTQQIRMAKFAQTIRYQLDNAGRFQTGEVSEPVWVSFDSIAVHIRTHAGRILE